jgi:signal transduction histidine kinase
VAATTSTRAPTAVAGDGHGGSPASGQSQGPYRRYGLAVLLIVLSVGIGGLINELATGRVPENWRFEVLLGILFFAGAAIFAAILLTRTWRELTAAKELLTIATGNLARAYDSLVETNRSLSETAEARDRALTHLQAAIRERETFLASVSHDLKSPLTIIKGHSDLLARHVRDSPAPNPARLASGLDRIAVSSARLTTMVDDLLWLASLDMDKQVDFRRTPTDLVALTQRTISDYAGTTSRHQLEFTPEVDRLIGWWDEKGIERVIANLLSNAIKYSPEGGEIAIDISEADGGKAAVLRVTDPGVGIPERDLPHIFERFYRAENIESLVTGTGLGLSGVRHAVEANGGSVLVSSREGHGSTFTVRLPLGQPPREIQAAD